MSDERQKAILDFIKNAKVVVADKIPPSRKRIRSVLQDVGVEKDNIHEVSSLEDGKKVCKKELPTIMIVDIKIKSGTGFELIDFYKKRFAEAEDCIFLVVTGDNSHQAVSQATEYDIDGFILKPFTVDFLISSVEDSVSDKIFPSDYILRINEGIKQLELGKTKEAYKLFKEAKKLDEYPSLAHYYISQCYVVEERTSEVEAELKKGLTFNPIHKQCLTALFHFYNSNKDFIKAFEIIKVTIKFYPHNPTRLSIAIRLAVINKDYGYLEEFHKVYKSLGPRAKMVFDFMCSGLCVGGRYFLLEGKLEKGLDYFNKVLGVFNGEVRFLKNIIENLVEFDLYDECGKYLDAFPGFERSGEDYKICEFYCSVSNKAPSEVIKSAEEFSKMGLDTYALNLILAQNLTKIGEDNKVVNIKDHVKKQWPDKINSFAVKLSGKKEA